MSEMVERVAKAIHQERFGGKLIWGHYPDSEKACLEEARAAVEAMREPTESMISKGYDHVDYGGAHIESAWRAMVDEALK